MCAHVCVLCGRVGGGELEPDETLSELGRFLNPRVPAVVSHWACHLDAPKAHVIPGFPARQLRLPPLGIAGEASLDLLDCIPCRPHHGGSHRVPVSPFEALSPGRRRFSDSLTCARHPGTQLTTITFPDPSQKGVPPQVGSGSLGKCSPSLIFSRVSHTSSIY